LARWALSNLPVEYGIGEPFLKSLRGLIDAKNGEPGSNPGPGPVGRLAARLRRSYSYRASLRLWQNLRIYHGSTHRQSLAASAPATPRGQWLRERLGTGVFTELRTLLWMARGLAHPPEADVRDALPPTTRSGRLASGVLGEEGFRAVRRVFRQLRAWSWANPRRAPAASRAFSGAFSIDAGLPFGVNLIGYLDTESGIGEIGRSMARVLQHAGIPHVLRNVPQTWLRRKDETFLQFSTSNPYAINMLVVNADQVPRVVDQIGREALAGRNNIGYWFWELSTFPDRYDHAFGYFDEIWVASHFCREAIAERSPIPVLRMPPGFEFRSPGESHRSEFGFDSSDFVFLYVFDGASFLKRKNPGAAVSAFRRAFPAPGQERLILKAINTPPAKMAALRRLAGTSRVDVIGDYLDRNRLLDLIGAADCYVSLHRSEGFGLTILEAMSLGKPVVATDYSGSRDLLYEGVGFPVRFRMARLSRDFGPYPKGALWAEPDVGHAADCLVRIRSRPEMAARVGERAREEIRATWSLSVRSRPIRQRLLEIAAERRPRGAGDRVA